MSQSVRERVTNRDVFFRIRPVTTALTPFHWDSDEQREMEQEPSNDKPAIMEPHVRLLVRWSVGSRDGMFIGRLDGQPVLIS